MSQGFWVHGMPARNIDQVISYLSGDAHDQYKVRWYDGQDFLTVVDSFPITIPRSKAASDRYFKVCPVCGAGSYKPCKTIKTRRVTDTHLPRINS